MNPELVIPGLTGNPGIQGLDSRVRGNDGERTEQD
ncbi:MAG: hypothetical protein H6R14_2364 [Proteobacteria bacterium]|nr:hypothetical protein [Pseudomonadota bacterium]